MRLPFDLLSELPEWALFLLLSCVHAISRTLIALNLHHCCLLFSGTTLPISLFA